jgi:hypothetical protein
MARRIISMNQSSREEKKSEKDECEEKGRNKVDPA